MSRLDGSVAMDLGVGDVHVPAASGQVSGYSDGTQDDRDKQTPSGTEAALEDAGASDTGAIAGVGASDDTAPVEVVPVMPRGPYRKPSLTISYDHPVHGKFEIRHMRDRSFLARLPAVDISKCLDKS